MKVVSTDRKLANNLTSLIICLFVFLSNWFFSFVFVKPNRIFVLFYLVNLNK